MSLADVANLAKYTQSQDKRSRLNRQFNYAFVGNASLQSQAHSITSNGGSGGLQEGKVVYGGGTTSQHQQHYRMMDNNNYLATKF